MPTQGTYFLNTSSFATATAIYTDSALTTAASNGWYKTSSNTFRQQTGAPSTPVLSTTYTCECTTFSSSTVESSESAACGATINQTYFHTGSGSTPVATNTCYSDAGQTVLGNGYYKLTSTTFMQITGGSGVVASVGTISVGIAFSSGRSATPAAAACADTLNQTYYHNGSSGQPPVATDVCYSDLCKTTVLGNGYYKISTAGTGTYMQITGGSGVVSAVTNCPSSLTSYSSSVKGVFNQACPFNGSNPGLTETYYHNGGGSAGTPPTSGDTCYSDSAGTTVLIAGYYNLDSNTGVGNRSYIEIGASGVVSFGYPQTC
tara:strand:+ start:246 stop:1199 length:954 start_codon:yes stop_codon:yes gene_type:complete